MIVCYTVSLHCLTGSDDDDVTITSDEERDIMKEIKEEIKKNVATEMHKELEVYRYLVYL